MFSSKFQRVVDGMSIVDMALRGKVYSKQITCHDLSAVHVCTVYRCKSTIYNNFSTSDYNIPDVGDYRIYRYGLRSRIVSLVGGARNE